MSNDEVDKYFSERSEEERGQIKSLIYISSNFSEDDSANEAVFNEFKNANLDSSKSLISTNFFAEKSNFVNGTASLSNTIEVSHEYHMAQLAGVTNAYELGIFMNAADKARYESGNYMIIDTKFTSSEATDFLSTMTQLAKDKMDEARGTAVFDDYKEAFERYSRMNDNYNDLVAKEESTKVNIQV
jgi:hypothetical protein